jgi:ABC-type uncharacterized transport system involved in gliding motility auxiliary subunit
MSAKPSATRIIVVGDSDFASDGYMQNDNRNVGFLVQAADWLSNDDDIIAIRNRQSGVGRLNKIADPGQRAVVMLFSRTLNTILIPLLVIVALIVVTQVRRAKMKREVQTNAD